MAVGTIPRAAKLKASSTAALIPPARAISSRLTKIARRPCIKCGARFSEGHRSNLGRSVNKTEGSFLRSEAAFSVFYFPRAKTRLRPLLPALQLLLPLYELVQLNPPRRERFLHILDHP